MEFSGSEWNEGDTYTLAAEKKEGRLSWVILTQ